MMRTPKNATDRMMGTRPLPPTRGVISLQEIYRLDEAKVRLGWTDSTYRAARRRGLLVLESGKRRYVTGQEILRYLELSVSAK